MVLKPSNKQKISIYKHKGSSHEEFLQIPWKFKDSMQGYLSKKKFLNCMKKEFWNYKIINDYEQQK